MRRSLLHIQNDVSIPCLAVRRLRFSLPLSLQRHILSPTYRRDGEDVHSLVRVGWWKRNRVGGSSDVSECWFSVFYVLETALITSESRRIVEILALFKIFDLAHFTARIGGKAADSCAIQSVGQWTLKSRTMQEQAHLERSCARANGSLHWHVGHTCLSDNATFQISRAQRGGVQEEALKAEETLGVAQIYTRSLCADDLGTSRCLDASKYYLTGRKCHINLAGARNVRSFERHQIRVPRAIIIFEGLCTLNAIQNSFAVHDAELS